MKSIRQPGVNARRQNSAENGRLLQKCNAPRFAGAPDALYERHLKSDNFVESETSDARERYARSRSAPTLMRPALALSKSSACLA
jgi:hypothetical protein